jgi:hypothetical protein
MSPNNRVPTERDRIDRERLARSPVDPAPFAIELRRSDAGDLKTQRSPNLFTQKEFSRSLAIDFKTPLDGTKIRDTIYTT